MAERREGGADVWRGEGGVGRGCSCLPPPRPTFLSVEAVASTGVTFRSFLKAAPLDGGWVALQLAESQTATVFQSLEPPLPRSFLSYKILFTSENGNEGKNHEDLTLSTEVFCAFHGAL